MNDTIWKAIGKFGLPTVAAIIFGYVLLAEVRADQQLLKEQHNALVVEQANLARGILKLADRSGETQMLQEKVLLVMRVMCLQQAVSNLEKAECMRER